jgi:hypothetical protein
MNDKLEEM